jgi:hypothetical protein
MNKFKWRVLRALTLIFDLLVVALVIFVGAFCGCSVKPLENESYSCFYSRSCMDKYKDYAACKDLISTCNNINIQDECKKQIKNPGEGGSVYRDYQDCLNQLK